MTTQQYEDLADCERALFDLHKQGRTDEAVAHCRGHACSESVLCQRYLGWFYGSKGQASEAISWYLKAAKQGSDGALDEAWKFVYMLARADDNASVIALLEQSPFAEYLPSQRFLTKMFHDRGDVVAALMWSKRACEHGNVDDLLYVARMHLFQQNPELAVAYLNKAVEAKSGRAHQLLGEMYAFGVGVSSNKDLASEHYKQAAAQGYLLSKARLIHLELRSSSKIRSVGLVAALWFNIAQALLIRWFRRGDWRIADIPDNVRDGSAL